MDDKVERSLTQGARDALSSVPNRQTICMLLSLMRSIYIDQFSSTPVPTEALFNGD